ncbi:carnitine O-palmitoyltransferase 2, mitochondrial-like isoform X2 [Oscarella lobularis]|uniref:carnitine O-palmitoyltransferase 2, mitochondrial-like isoform X2 n=1 Tax=Oscarella lobularis TaxID=121494 RepID=UPI00331385F5
MRCCVRPAKAKSYWKPVSSVLSSVRSSSSSTTNPDDSDLIQESIVPTFHFQASLPRLPIPRLAETKRRYLNAFEPIASSNEEHASATKAIDDFASNEGQRLHEELVERDKANKHTNFITGPWSSMYLRDRRSIMLNHNPFLLMQDDSRPEFRDQLVRAAVLIRSSLRFMNSLRKSVLEPDVFHTQPDKSTTPFFQNFISRVPSSLSWYPAYFLSAFPLDMSQYKNLFSSTRIPQLGRDVLVADEQAKHIVVLKGGHFYAFDVIKTNGTLASTSDIYNQLKSISEDRAPPAVPVSVLTSEERDTWAVARSELEATNKETLNQIDSAILLLCLDDDNVDKFEDAVPSFLRGNGQNRWFDKSFQLILDKSGQAAIHFEHAWGDGISILRYVNDMYKDSLQSTFSPTSIRGGESGEVRRLDFKLDSEVRVAIEKAKKRFDERVAQLSVHHIQYEKFGKKFIKSKKQNADAILQLTLQAAFYAQYGFIPSTYESCSTAAFKHGRTETVRSATMETAAFIKAIQSGNKSQLAELLTKVSAKHSTLTGEAQKGQGFDRHLFALKCLAEEKGLTPEFFQHPSYLKMGHIILSTSTLPPAEALVFGGFAPVTPDGLGVGYGGRDDVLGYGVTAYPTRDPFEYLKNVEKTLDVIYDVLKSIA